MKTAIWSVACATDAVTEEKSVSACSSPADDASRFARICDTRSWFAGPSTSETLRETSRISSRIWGASSLIVWSTDRPEGMSGTGSSETVARSGSAGSPEEMPT